MGELYFKRINYKQTGESFGEDSLLRNTTRNATIKAEDGPVYFATLSKDRFMVSLAKIEEEKAMRKIDFVHSIPSFATMNEKRIL